MTESYENYRKWPNLDDLCQFLQHQVKIACQPPNKDTTAQQDRGQGRGEKQNVSEGLARGLAITPAASKNTRMNVSNVT